MMLINKPGSAPGISVGSSCDVTGKNSGLLQKKRQRICKEPERLHLRLLDVASRSLVRFC